MQCEFIRLIRPRSLKLPENILNEGDVDEIKRLPCHLVFVVGCEEISFVDLSKIIDWCVALGISHVSFYDRYGKYYIDKYICWLNIKILFSFIYDITLFH